MRLYDADASGEREDTAEVMATRHGGFEIKQRKAPENMIAWINSSPVLKPLFCQLAPRPTDATRTPAEHNENFCNFFSRTTASFGTIDFHATFPEMSKFLSRKNFFVDHARQKSSPENFHWKCGRIHRASLIWFRLVCCVPLVVCLHRMFGKVKSCVILISLAPRRKLVSGVNSDPVSSESVNSGIKFKGWCVGVVFSSSDIKVCSFWITKSSFTSGVKQHCLRLWFVKLIQRNAYAIDFCCKLIFNSTYFSLFRYFFNSFSCPRWSWKFSRDFD